MAEVFEAAAGRAALNFQKNGIDLDRVSFRELETILAVHGYAAITDSDGLIRVIPDANVRQYGVPLLTGKADLGDAAVVTKVIPVAHLEAAQLVPPLRPLLPQYGHLVAVPGSNALVIVSRYADVKAVEALVHELDKDAPLTRADARPLPQGER